MGSKYIDIGIALFMAYFAYTRFVSGQTGFAILFTVLFILNVVTAVVKHRVASSNPESTKK